MWGSRERSRHTGWIKGIILCNFWRLGRRRWCSTGHGLSMVRWWLWSLGPVRREEGVRRMESLMLSRVLDAFFFLFPSQCKCGVDYHARMDSCKRRILFLPAIQSPTPLISKHSMLPLHLSAHISKQVSDDSVVHMLLSLSTLPSPMVSLMSSAFFLLNFFIRSKHVLRCSIGMVIGMGQNVGHPVPWENRNTPVPQDLKP